MKLFLAVVAFLFLMAFLLILMIEVPSPDLIAVAAITLVLAGIDFARGSRRPRN